MANWLCCWGQLTIAMYVMQLLQSPYCEPHWLAALYPSPPLALIVPTLTRQGCSDLMMASALAPSCLQGQV
ncbi:hypothetical protein BO78DRAFT_246390 [Aspergillus sclerotiicarbonarius CBS 121057]|uniref:Uncharacterized protein n=1 Tax=Aspergillus sclerotiicarbonarius (strain CBS 121057 / IBT 28362) TaxID=1448318 RepID=A0A319DV38_ASPSB|nr:hypothetical protein BO78DRAFT_246390 [Aspergillus sclerotiicarbonarius CBS 121057]